ncbi:ATP-binding protein [Paucidesulfovibrio longus]|uniref:ATP-binding protein n=1 Tax=Paucidesulfovibrio longus TaxID=889 RepID=UPI0003B4FDF5|nr:ATP-binding protein [Paucidesulfovibrio longus]
MLNVSEREVLERMVSDNPWWESGGVAAFYDDLGRRDYFPEFYRLLAVSTVRRAVVLMGPRRVGKTVMLFQTVAELLRAGQNPTRILYVSVDMPLFQGMPLERLMRLFMERNGIDRQERMVVLFDEIQYLPDWERHLKSLMDTYLHARVAVSGSAAAALKLKSDESGAGRFTDYLLPPLTFAEYLALIGREGELVREQEAHQPELPNYSVRDMAGLNAEFLNYLNYGGYPEAVADPEVRGDPARFIKRDIVDKVLLRDLPSLYGIQDIQELNRLLNTVVYNSGNVLSLDQLSKSSGVSKDTIRKYLEYLEAAFLIRKVRRMDEHGRWFQRERSFKVYLTNPSLRAALFSPVRDGDEAMGLLTETAIFSQWFHCREELAYARWKTGEVDLVHLDQLGQPRWALEVKWTDRYYDSPEELKGLLTFARNVLRAPASTVTVTTKTRSGERSVQGQRIDFIPASLYCYTVGKNLLQWAKRGMGENENGE